MKERDISLDLIRVLACCMVVMMHSPMVSDNANGPFLMATSFFTAPSIGLFFMVSGALLMPVKTDYITFIKRRFSKVVIPTLCWTVIYLSINLLYSGSEINVLSTIASIPFCPQGEGVLWFMYTLSGVYLIAPILSGWLEKTKKSEIEIVLSLWAITLCYPILEKYVGIDTSTTGILYYFAGYAGYFLLGYYLKMYHKTIPLIYPLMITILGISLIFGMKYYGVEFDFYKYFWYLSVVVVSFAIVIWKLLRSIKLHACSGWLSDISNLTFGVYLCHILIMRKFLWKADCIVNIDNYIVQTLVVAGLTIVISLILCWMISYIPGSQWIIAVHKRIKN